MKTKLVTDRLQLSKKTEPVKDQEELDKIVQDLEDSFVGLEATGLGLAAPQIGINKAVSIIRMRGVKKEYTIINPIILSKERPTRWPEGCLSFSGITVQTRRYLIVDVETGLPGQRSVIHAEGIEAVVLQHEVDHLNGILMFSRKWH